MNSIYLSVVIPVYNENKSIKTAIQETIKFFNARSFNYEIIIVDDGSKDNTVKIAKETAEELNSNIIIFKNDVNYGKGYSLKKGIMSAKGEIILFFDADLSTPLKAFDEMLPFLNQDYDVVMGSRHLSESKILVRESKIREFLGNIFTKIVFSFFLKGITDTNCGFKVYRREVGQKLYSLLTINRWGFDVEIIYIAQKYNYKIKEVPVYWSHDAHSKVKIISAVLNTLKELAQIKINDWKGKY